MSTIQTNLRNADLADLAALLKDQHARKVDIVAPASKLRSEAGVLVVEGADAELSEDGVTATDGRYRPTAVFDEGVAEKLGVPLAYVRKLREQRPDLYDANVNGWLHGQVRVTINAQNSEGDEFTYRTKAAPFAPTDPRSFLVRTFRGDSGEGVARAFLSDSYKVMDNLDVLMAALDGVKQAGVETAIDGCDLTERRMSVRVVAPEVRALAPTLLRDYRSPFDHGVSRAGRSGGEWAPQDVAGRGTVDPIVFAGFQITNSETGGGAFSLTPRIVALTCLNGMTITADAFRAVHLGGKLDEGVVKWTEDTQRKQLALVTAKTRDTVATFLSGDYVERTIERIETQAGKAITGNAADAITTLGKRLAYDQGTIEGILDHFIRGGQMTAGGVLNAVTSYAQTVEDADKAQDVEASALRALELAATS
jgi:hypothetical protein